MPKAKKLRSVEGARRRPKKPNAEQSSQMPSGGLNLLQVLDAWQDAELQSRIDHDQRLAQEVDEHYEYKLFAGKGKQAMERANEYLRIQHEIFERVSKDVQELQCRRRVRREIARLTQMQTADPQIRILEDRKSTMRSGKHVAEATLPNEENAILRELVSKLLGKVKAGEVTFKGAPETENPTPAGKPK